MSEPSGRWQGVKRDSPETHVWPVMPGYPDDYQDPEWDGSEAEFRDKVIPARLAAIEQVMNEHLAAHGLTLRWQQDGS